MNIKKYLYSEANIFHAIYSIKESIQEKNILDTNDKDDLLELFDVFNEDKIQKKIQEIRPMLKEYLEKDDKLFKAKVYFVPKSWDTSNNKAKYRPLHTASLNEQICMLAMLNCLVGDLNARDNRWKIGGIAKMIPADFYGNIVSELPERTYKRWQSQYADYTQEANDLQKEYRSTSEYRYEISLDIKDFFPSINPYYILCYYMKRLPIDIGEDDRKVFEKILVKLLYIELDISNLNQEFLKIYYNTEKHIDRTAKQYVRGVAQGLIQGYFFANLFMVEVSNIYRNIFCGRQLFYVDDSVIFSNKEITKNNGNEFGNLIQKAEDAINKFVEDEIKNQTIKNNIVTELSNNNEFTIKIHNPQKEGDECKSTYIDLQSVTRGEIFLSNIGRIASGVAAELNNDFNAEEMDMLENRLDILQREIKQEITMVSEAITKEQEKGGEKNNELLARYINYKKHLIRYRKYFYYRYRMINYRKNFSLREIKKFINKRIKYINKNGENGKQSIFEEYTDNILGALLSFFIKNLANDQYCNNEKVWNREKDIYKIVTTLNDYLYKDNAGNYKEKLSYVFKSLEDYIYCHTKENDGEKLLEIQERRRADLTQYRYKSLLEKIRNHFPEMGRIAEDKKNNFIKAYLKSICKNENKIYELFDNKEKMKNIYSIVESNSNEIKRMILNASVSYLYNICISEGYDFAKQNNRALTYSEIRLLVLMRNREFSIDTMGAKLDKIYDAEDKIDYNILEVLHYFKRFVKQYEYIDQLICVHKYTCDLWKNGSKYLYFYTMHNQEHAIDLIKSSIELVRAINYFKLKTIDYYILFIACYLHDISMVNIPNLRIFQKSMKDSNLIAADFAKEFYEEKKYDFSYTKGMLLNAYKAIDEFFEKLVRNNHAEQSAWEIRHTKDLNFLDECMKGVVAEVSAAHGYKTADVYRRKSVAQEMTYSLKYMQIILRLADLLDMKKYRISKLLLSKNLENMSGTSAFHWISHSVTNDLKINVTYSTKDGNVNITGKDADYYSFLQSGRIEEKIELEIHYCAMPKIAYMRREKCKGVDMMLEKEDIVIHIREKNNPPIVCDGTKCNMACKWFSVKNEYLLEELVELQRYLEDVSDNFFSNSFSIRLVDDGEDKLMQKQFDIVKEYINRY